MRKYNERHWHIFCDELVIMSEHDEELKKGLAWLDRKFGDGGKKSIYEVLWQVIFESPKMETQNMGDFMKNLTRKPKNE
tara:strand:+ start:2686 stop:2922 length:237 start_codon:yes stop_codon:yes gene_type:complete